MIISAAKQEKSVWKAIAHATAVTRNVQVFDVNNYRREMKEKNLSEMADSFQVIIKNNL
jgi:hypothetical protein